jgi:hypothetical protein
MLLSNYYIERFRSMGDLYFYELANKIENIKAIWDQNFGGPNKSTHLGTISEKNL